MGNEYLSEQIFQDVARIIIVLFLVIWGAYERISAIRKGRRHAGAADQDRNSLIIFYITIFTGYGVGVPLAFTSLGKINWCVPFISMTGLAVVALGLTIRLAAIRTLAEQFTYTVKIIDGHNLITSGIYSYIRHPSYTGQSLIFLGCGMALSNWLSILFLFLPNFLAALYRISIEEKVLADHFPGRYEEYRAGTKRLIPWVF